MIFNKGLSALVIVTSIFASIGFAQENLSLENWDRMKIFLAAQENKVIKFSNSEADGSINEVFMASSEIGILVGTEKIKKDKSGNIATVMWHFVVSEDGTISRFLHRIVIKDSENLVIKIQGIDSTDAENTAKLEELKTDLYKKVLKSLSKQITI